MDDIQPGDEIDLIQLIETIWNGKWKIIAITASCVMGVLGFQILGPAPSFVATTEIKPILAGDAKIAGNRTLWRFLQSIGILRQKTRRTVYIDRDNAVGVRDRDRIG